LAAYTEVGRAFWAFRQTPGKLSLMLRELGRNANPWRPVR
jgi:hypothetical protein